MSNDTSHSATASCNTTTYDSHSFNKLATLGHAIFRMILFYTITDNIIANTRFSRDNQTQDMRDTYSTNICF